MASIIILYSSTFVEDETQQIQTALLWTFITFLISIEDISTDALAIKELEDPELASYLQQIMQQMGAVCGSLGFMELISEEGILRDLGFNVPILAPNQFITYISIFTLLAGLIIHFSYREKSKKEEEGFNHTFW